MKTIILGIWLTCSADAASTHYALNHGAREALMPSQNPTILDTIAVGEAAASTYSLIWLDKNKRPKTARILGVVIIATRSAVIASNINQMRKR